MAPSARAKGAKAFCSWDEDAVTMSVEAARSALKGCPHAIEALSLASTTMPNADLQHSALVATVLDLPTGIRTSDLGFSQRAGTSALLEALLGEGGALVVAADRPLAKPASAQELSYGAGAAAFTLGSETVLARLIASASVTAPLVDHFRPSGSDYDYVWEERWIREEGYLKLVPAAVGKALSAAGVSAGDLHYLVLSSPSSGIASLVAKALKFAGAVIDPLRDRCGFTGVADPLLGLIAALEAAKPGERILLIGFGLRRDRPGGD
jgi:3-hydroxy-3-methylglutaryl CoA synthase